MRSGSRVPARALQKTHAAAEPPNSFTTHSASDARPRRGAHGSAEWPRGSGPLAEPDQRYGVSIDRCRPSPIRHHPFQATANRFAVRRGISSNPRDSQ